MNFWRLVMNAKRPAFICVVVAAILIDVFTANAQTANKQTATTGFAVKKPIIQGAPPGAPWGAMAEIVKTIMKPYGWDVQICYYCNGAARAARLVSKAALAAPPA